MIKKNIYIIVALSLLWHISLFRWFALCCFRQQGRRSVFFFQQTQFYLRATLTTFSSFHNARKPTPRFLPCKVLAPLIASLWFTERLLLPQPPRLASRICAKSVTLRLCAGVLIWTIRGECRVECSQLLARRIEAPTMCSFNLHTLPPAAQSLQTFQFWPAPRRDIVVSSTWFSPSHFNASSVFPGLRQSHNNNRDVFLLFFLGCAVLTTAVFPPNLISISRNEGKPVKELCASL